MANGQTQNQQPPGNNLMGGLLGDLSQFFFKSAAAPEPAPGGESGLVKLFQRMQSTNPDRNSLEDMVLQLMLRSAIAKSQVPQGALQPNVNVPAPGMPQGPQGPPMISPGGRGIF